MARKTHTSTEVKARYNNKTYTTYRANLRKDEDAALIEFIEANREKYGITDYFRIGVEAVMKSENE